MPTLFLDSTDTGSNITRSIVTSIMNDVVHTAKLPQDKIQYVGELGKALAPGTAINDETDVTFSKGNLVRLSATEEYDEHGLYTSCMASENHLDVFTDTSLGIRLKPYYASYKATLEFTIRAQSKSEAVSMRNRIRSLVELGQVIGGHSPSYNVPLPEKSLVILYQLHQMREANHPTGEDLGTYLKKNSSPKLSVISNSAGKHATFVLAETQTGIYGTYEFDVPPVETAQGEGSTWETSFTYTVQYNKVTGFRLHYPVSIHNRLIPRELRPTVNLNYELPEDTTVLSSFYNGIVDTMGGPIRVGGWRSPVFDDWDIPQPKRHVSPCIQMLSQVDESDRGLVMALDDMGAYSMSSEIIDYIIDCDKRVFDYGHSAVLIELYENNHVYDGRELMVVDGSIYATEDLVPTNQYRLCIGVVNDLSTLSDTALATMCNHPEATKQILIALEPTIEKHGLLPRVIRGKVVNRELRIALEYIATTSKHYRPGGYVDRMRVGYLTIKTGDN